MTLSVTPCDAHGGEEDCALEGPDLLVIADESTDRWLAQASAQHCMLVIKQTAPSTKDFAKMFSHTHICAHVHLAQHRS